MPSVLSHPLPGAFVRAAIRPRAAVRPPSAPAAPRRLRDYPPTRWERMQDSFTSHVSIAVAIAAVAHYLFLSLASFDAMPDFSIRSGPPMEQLQLQQEYEVPPPPENIPRPAVPVLSTDLQLDPDLTIGSVLLRDNPVELQALPPPPTPAGVDMAEQPSFTPYEVRPELKNASEIQRLLERGYPMKYREAGIGGLVVLWVFIDEGGQVRNTRVVQGTGYPELDELAQQVLREAGQFSPAYNRDQRVRVWIQIPLTFQTRDL